MKHITKALFTQLGSVDISAQPDECANETEKAKIPLGQLLKSRKDTAIVLDLADEALDQMTFFVKMLIVAIRLRTVRPRWDHGLCTTIDHRLPEIVGVVRLVRDHKLAFVPVDERVGLSDIVPLSAGQREAQGVAQGIHTDMDLRAETAPATSQGLLRLPAVFLERASSTRMSTDDRAVNEQVLHVRIIDEMLVHLLPDVVIAPSCISFVDTVPLAI